MYQEISLDYSLNDLAPYLNKDVLTVHLKIYKDYLNELNKLLNREHYNYTYSLQDLINHIDIFNLNVRGEILYYLGSVLNHNLYFFNLSNKGNNIPVKTILKDINKNFTSYDNFKDLFIKSALNLKGSGYTFLVNGRKGILKIINTSNEDSPYFYGYTPIIALDLWEHAYFLEYQDNRLAYINSFFKVLDFEKINLYYEQVLKEEL